MVELLRLMLRSRRIPLQTLKALYRRGWLSLDVLDAWVTEGLLTTDELAIVVEG